MKILNIFFFQKVDNCKFITRKLSLCQLLHIHWIIIHNVTSLYLPLLKYRIYSAWKCNFNTRGIKLQVLSHFSNMLIKSKRWPSQWGTIIYEQWFAKWFYNKSTLSIQIQINNISFIYQGMLWYWKVRAINNLIDNQNQTKAMSPTKINLTGECINCKKLILL